MMIIFVTTWRPDLNLSNIAKVLFILAEEIDSKLAKQT